jgi:hypothetical protein
MTDGPSQSKVDQFITEQIPSVPHLEALLLIWNKRPKQWSVDEMANYLYVPADAASRILDELAARALIVEGGDQLYAYNSDSAERDDLLRNVDTTYRRELVRVSGMIHSKASAAVRDFARAFRFKKD